MYFRYVDKIKTFSNMQRLKELITSGPTYKKCLKTFRQMKIPNINLGLRKGMKITLNEAS